MARPGMDDEGGAAGAAKKKKKKKGVWFVVCVCGSWSVVCGMQFAVAVSVDSAAHRQQQSLNPESSDRSTREAADPRSEILKSRL
eukprot:2550665-Rhodomonas_salina.1